MKLNQCKIHITASSLRVIRGVAKETAVGHRHLSSDHSDTVSLMEKGNNCQRAIAIFAIQQILELL